MIVKIIPSPSNKNIGAVNYNTNKIERNKGELMKVANFGPLQAFNNLRPQDYINYLQLVTNQNKNIRKPQFHVAISAKNRSYDKSALTIIAEVWLREMGYGDQPYLIVFHKDTVHNHVHIVSTRINKQGKKISSAWEHIRAQKSMNKVLGYEFAFSYRFSTKAQFLMLLENQGYPGRDPDERKIQERIEQFVPDKVRGLAIKEIFLKYKEQPDFEKVLHEKFGIDLAFHSFEGKRPYGYSIIDHNEKQVFKGSEVLPLKEILNMANKDRLKDEEVQPMEMSSSGTHIQSVSITDDVDDQQIHGMRRRRQKKARTNTR